jgi:hypothetical protein
MVFNQGRPEIKKRFRFIRTVADCDHGFRLTRPVTQRRVGQ